MNNIFGVSTLLFLYYLFILQSNWKVRPSDGVPDRVTCFYSIPAFVVLKSISSAINTALPNKSVQYLSAKHDLLKVAPSSGVRRKFSCGVVWFRVIWWSFAFGVRSL